MENLSLFILCSIISLKNLGKIEFMAFQAFLFFYFNCFIRGIFLHHFIVDLNDFYRPFLVVERQLNIFFNQLSFFYTQLQLFFFVIITSLFILLNISSPHSQKLFIEIFLNEPPQNSPTLIHTKIASNPALQLTLTDKIIRALKRNTSDCWKVRYKTNLNVTKENSKYEKHKKRFLWQYKLTTFSAQQTNGKSEWIEFCVWKIVSEKRKSRWTIRRAFRREKWQHFPESETLSAKPLLFV